MDCSLHEKTDNTPLRVGNNTINRIFSKEMLQSPFLDTVWLDERSVRLLEPDCETLPISPLLRSNHCPGTDRTKQKCQNFRGTAISGRCKCSLGGSLRNILLHSPEYGFIIPVGILDILERIRRRLWFWTSCSTPQKRHDLGTGTRHVGRKCCIGGTGGNIVFICPYGGTQSQYAKLPSIL